MSELNVSAAKAWLQLDALPRALDTGKPPLANAVTVADHRDQKALRAHGVLSGEAEDGGTSHFTSGAHGRLLSNTVSPAEYARRSR